MQLITRPAALAARRDYQESPGWYMRVGSSWYLTGQIPGTDWEPTGVFLVNDGTRDYGLVFTDTGRAYRAILGLYSTTTNWLELSWQPTTDQQLVHLWYDALHNKLIGVGYTGDVYEIQNVWTGTMTKVGQVPYDPTTIYPTGGPSAGRTDEGYRIWPYMTSGVGWRHNDYCMDSKGRIHAVCREPPDRQRTEYTYSDDYGKTWGGGQYLQSCALDYGSDGETTGLIRHAIGEENHIVCQGDNVHVLLSIRADLYKSTGTFPQPSWEHEPFEYDIFERQLYYVIHLYSTSRGETWARQDVCKLVKMTWDHRYAYPGALGQWLTESLEYKSGRDANYKDDADVFDLAGDCVHRVALSAGPSKTFLSYMIIQLIAEDYKLCIEAAEDGPSSPLYTRQARRHGIGPGSRNWMGSDAVSVMVGQGAMFMGDPTGPEASDIIYYTAGGSGSDTRLSGTRFWFHIPYSVRWPKSVGASGYSFWW